MIIELPCVLLLKFDLLNIVKVRIIIIVIENMEDLPFKDSLSKKWTDIYKPEHIKDIVGNEYAKMDIEHWLMNYEKNKSISLKSKKKSNKNKTKSKKKSPSSKSDCASDNDDDDIVQYVQTRKGKNHKGHSCMIVTGNHGIGKTCTVTAIANSLGYSLRTINFNKITHSKSPTEFATKILKPTNIYNIVSGEKLQKFTVIIDNLESITSQIERKFIDALVRENEQKWCFPIIFISNNKHIKFINNIKKDTFEVKMQSPTKQNLEDVLLRVCVKNKMKMSSEIIAEMIIDHSQEDYRRLLTTLEDLYRSYGTEEITEDKVKGYFEFYKKKDININLFTSTIELFSNFNMSIEDILVLFETERTILPIMVQQNNITCVSEYLKNKKHIFDVAENITESIAMGDVIENYIYGDQNWYLQELQGFYTCVYPSHMISNSINVSRMNNDLRYRSYKIEFPFDLNRTSIKHINVKNVRNASKELPSMDIPDFIYAKSILQTLLEEDRLDEYKKLTEGYSVSSSGIQSLLKIDKIVDTKTNIPPSITRKINVNTKK